MNNLLRILDSFQADWTQKEYVRDFAAILKERVVPTYSFLRPKIESNTLIEPKFNEEAVGDQRSALSLRIWKVFLYLIYACFINVEVKNINLTADC